MMWVPLFIFILESATEYNTFYPSCLVLSPKKIKLLTHLFPRLRYSSKRTPNRLQQQTQKITTAKQQSVTPRPHQTQILAIYHDYSRKTEVNGGSQEHGSNCQRDQICKEIGFQERIEVYFDSASVSYDLERYPDEDRDRDA
jgi:hypothetical protein